MRRARRTAAAPSNRQSRGASQVGRDAGVVPGREMAAALEERRQPPGRRRLTGVLDGRWWRERDHRRPIAVEQLDAARRTAARGAPAVRPRPADAPSSRAATGRVAPASARSGGSPRPRPRRPGRSRRPAGRPGRVGQRRRQLVDRPPAAPLEDVDADHVAVHGPDPAGDLAERARSVGQPERGRGRRSHGRKVPTPAHATGHRAVTAP